MHTASVRDARDHRVDGEWTAKDRFCSCERRDLLYAVREYERGIYSGRVISLFFKPLGKHADGAILAKVECYLWLGLEKQKACCFRDLPQGFNVEYAFQVPGDTEQIPRALNYFGETPLYNNLT
ncbi:otoferlin [Caerostris extrusa]|uniref:Otoferlin n=1 Tax=Caerostris extrusa TaxID=172846 RepID=A0AAV4M549_CAEEX|nr:otoferlin [Caerostris extrusa]